MKMYAKPNQTKGLEQKKIINGSFSSDDDCCDWVIQFWYNCRN